MGSEKEVVLITGSCGRIGSSLVRRLGKQYRIVGFELLKALYASENEELVPVDLSSDESVHQAFKGEWKPWHHCADDESGFRDAAYAAAVLRGFGSAGDPPQKVQDRGGPAATR